MNLGTQKEIDVMACSRIFRPCFRCLIFSVTIIGYTIRKVNGTIRPFNAFTVEASKTPPKVNPVIKNAGIA